MLDLRSNTNQQSLSLHQNEKETFKSDVLAGLSKPRKQIPSKYFYDKRGSALFNQIACHPDYYLTRSELIVLNTYKKKISKLFSTRKFNLIELGPGDGKKTDILIDQFSQDALDFCYSPVDISETYLNTLVAKLHTQRPNLHITPMCHDYCDSAKWLKNNHERRNIVLFLGSNIGNFDVATAEEFLHNLWKNLAQDDYLFMGFDLCKDVDILMQAYNDSNGITRAFNLNLLQRMNRELGANFNIDKFQHYGCYNAYKRTMESFIISTQAQVVEITALEKTFFFQSYEPILVEHSWKYQLPQIKQLAQRAGFEILQTFLDPVHLFADTLWRVKK